MLSATSQATSALSASSSERRRRKAANKLFSRGIPDPGNIPELPFRVPLQIQSEKASDGTYPDTKLGFRLVSLQTGCVFTKLDCCSVK